MRQKKSDGFRKMFAGLCMFCMLFMTCFGSMTVNAQEGAKIIASACRAERGKSVSITFNLEGNPGIWGLKFKVGFDHSALTLISASNGTIFSEGDVTPPETLDKEQYVYIASSNKLEDISANGTLMTLEFLVSDGAEFQSYPITLEITQAINIDGKDVEMAAENGNITVNEAAPEIPDNTPEVPENTPEAPADNTPEASADNTQNVPENNNTPADVPVKNPVDNSLAPVESPVAVINDNTNQSQKTTVKKTKVSPPTADNSNLAVCMTLVVLSGGILLTIRNSDKKREYN